MMACATLPIFRWRKDAPQAQFTVPYGIIASILSLILVVWLLSNVDYNKEGLAILIAVGTGIILYFALSFSKRFVKSSSTD